MDIRKFFGVATAGKKRECDTASKNEKSKNKDRVSDEKSKSKESKVKNSFHGEEFKPKQTSRKKRIIYDSDSEEEEQLVKKLKIPERKQSSKSDKIPKEDTVVLISETDEDLVKKASPKIKENGTSPGIRLETTGTPKADTSSKKNEKHFSPVKLVPTSVADYFGTGNVKRSEKKLVSSKRKETSQSPEAPLGDEIIARHLQLEETTELERQLHEDELFARTLTMLDDMPKKKKLERQLHEDELFARTLSMLDDMPKKKKPRRDAEEKQTISAIQINRDKMEKNEGGHQDKSTSSTFDSKHCARRDQTPTESARSISRTLGPYPEFSASKERKELGDKMQPSTTSSKLALLKQKGLSVKKENGIPERESIKEVRKTSDGKEVSPKEEKTSPKEISPHTSKSVSPENSEKKRANYQAYRSFLNREGPKALGSKDIPQGGENCLEGLTFVMTGVLESIERDEAKSLIERYGGKVTSNISKKTNYLIKGRDCGVSKCEKASALGTKIIDEDGLFDLIRNMPGKKSKYEAAAEVKAKITKSNWDKTPPKAEEKRKISPNKRESERKKQNLFLEKDVASKAVTMKTAEAKRGLDFGLESLGKKQDPKSSKCELVREKSKDQVEGILWVDKYKPTSLKTVIGQQGDQSCANKLLRWLQNWHKPKDTSDNKQGKHGKLGNKDDASRSKAALLSGPPGVGKTTTASLVCEELGMSYVELNASDTRSKNSLKEVVAESLNNTSIKGFCSGTSSSVSTKHVLIMDEVDGMAGNEDRGGIQELIDLIKHTKVPIICMCNDRNHPKIRSLVHYCFDLRFQRPRVEQIKGAMMSIAFREGLKIPPPAMNEIILAANQDIRQVLHNLSMWCAKSKTLTYDGVKEDASKAKKDIKLGPFDVVRKVFAAGEEHSRMSLIDKSDLFFHDYSLAPLFVQENYIHVKPAAAGNNMKKHLMLLSKAADSICDGDLVDQQIRTKQNWNLLPVQAIYSSVLPGELMRGYMSLFPNFPSWLGKFSCTGKHARIIQELSMHMSLRTHTSKRAVNLEYLSYLRDAIVNPLTWLGAEGVQDAVAFMDSYCLTKDDVENVTEVTSWEGKPGAFSKLDSKVKSAFTRAYNKAAHMAPYSLQMVKKSRRRVGSALNTEPHEGLEGEDEQSENEQETIENDAMIKKKTQVGPATKTRKK